jgi:RHS repeat-associated protein
VQYGYDDVGNLTSVTDPLGHVTQYAFDALDRRVQVTQPDPDGAGPLAAPVTLYQYDAAGNLVKVTDALGRETSYTYDALDRLAQQTMPDPDGAGPLAAAFTAYTYDAVGNVLTTRDALNHVTTTAYDGLDRVTSVTDPNSAVTAYTYDAAGNVLSVTDPNNNRTDYTYDGLNRKVSETIYLPGAASRTWTYDAAGNVLTATDRNGRTRRFTYDNLDRMTKEEWLASGVAVNTIAARYDAAGQLLELSDAGSDRLYFYDGLGRQVQVNSASPFGGPAVVLAAGYDAAGNVVGRSESISGNVASTAYLYDNLDRVVGEYQFLGAAAKRVNFAYNALGQVTQASRYADASGTTLVGSSAYGYDGANRLTAITHTSGAATLASYALAYDAADRVTSKASAADGTATFQYDNAGQLTQSSSPGQTSNYGYDPAGNRSSTGYATGAYNRLQSDGRYSYEYDAEGNRTKRTDTTTGATDDYTWDYRNRLTRVLSKSSGGAVTKDVRYAYDGEDNRVRKQVDGNGDGTYETTESYAYAGGQLALVLDGAGAVQERYLYGPGVDRPLAVERGGSVKWLLADDQGTVRDVLDASGAVVDHLAVDAFGVVASQTNAAAQPRFVYTGRELDAESGLYQYRARYYDAAAGRFLSEDPSGFAGGDANLYRYAGNSVTNLTDPSGLRPETPTESLERAVRVQQESREQRLDAAHDWLDKLDAGWVHVPGSNDNAAFEAEYRDNPAFREYADWRYQQRLANGPVFLPSYGDDWIYEAARQYEQYRRDFLDLPGRLQGALDEAAAAGVAALEAAGNFAYNVVDQAVEPVRMGGDLVRAIQFGVETWLGYEPEVPEWRSSLARLFPTDPSRQLDYLLEKQYQNLLYNGLGGLAAIGAGKALGAVFAEAEAGAAGGFLFRELEIDAYAAEMQQFSREAMAARIAYGQRRAAMLGERVIDRTPVTTPWQRRVYQRADIDWDLVRPEGAQLAGMTNRAAARQGYAPGRVNPQTGRWEDTVLHHSLDDPRGAVIETWRSSHTRFHNTIRRGPNDFNEFMGQSRPWRELRPDWADAWQREQSAYWRWRTGQYNPQPQPRLRLPGDP